MRKYLTQRLLMSLITLFGVLVIVFLLIRVSGDPALMYAGPEARPEDLVRIREDLGLNKPLWTQFAFYLTDIATLDFGTSFHWREPALDVVLSRLPATAKVAAMAFVISLLIGIPVGTYAAIRRGTPGDALARLFALAGQAMPNYWLGIMLILLLSVKFRIFPTSGTGGLMYLILPAITLGWSGTAATVRLLRSSMIDVLAQDYIRVAHSKGLTPATVIRRHAFRNSALPVMTLLGLQVANLLSGSALVETVFAIPGVGQLAVQAVFARDYPIVQAVVVLSATILIFTNLVVDIMYSVVDPRIRIGGQRS